MAEEEDGFMADTRDFTHATIGWIAYAAGTVGVAKGQTLRLSVVNLGPVDVNVRAGWTSNPVPVALLETSFSLQPGEGRGIDLRASDVPTELFDSGGRSQIRPFARASARTLLCNLEVFHDHTGITTIALPLQAVQTPG